MKKQSRFNEPKEVEDAEYDDVNGYGTRRHSFIGLGLLASRLPGHLITPLDCGTSSSSLYGQMDSN